MKQVRKSHLLFTFKLQNIFPQEICAIRLQGGSMRYSGTH